MVESGLAAYQIGPNLTDPRFQGFVTARGLRSVLGLKEAHDDFDVENPKSLDWKPRSLKAFWKPLPVIAPVNPFNDYPCVNGQPAFSRRAIDALGEMLTENGELLPLETDVGEYYAFNCMTKIDALDQENSRINRDDFQDTAVEIPFFALKAEVLAGASIFRIPELPYRHLVTNLFKERVDQAKLNGFEFHIIWPLPKGPSWIFLRQEARNEQRKKIKLQGHSLVISFLLQAAQSTDSEKTLADDLVKSLLAKLKVNSLEDKYHGFLENFEFADGEFRMFCSCPDCEELASYLANWLEQLNWPSEVQMVKRFGTLYDKRVKTKQVTVRKGKA